MASAVSCRLSFILLTLLLPISATAQSNGNMTVDSPMVAGGADPPRLSPSGEFAFGFKQIVHGGYLLAIWFNKIPEETIVWSANRDNPAPQGSRIQLFADGRFVLNDPSGRRIWDADTAASGAAYGALLNGGNFVLARNNSVPVWQSFDHPTDTLLPTQEMNPEADGNLISSFSETNYSRGRFKLSMESDGNLVFYSRNFPLDRSVYPYWSSNTGVAGSQLIFNQSGYLYLVATNGTILRSLFSKAVPSSQFYQRVILEYDGVLRHYLYPKFANSTGGRPMEWSINVHFPSNICILMGGRDLPGPGLCGYNSYCTLGTDQRPKCDCPRRYSKIDPNDTMSGCKPDFVQQSCDQQSEETNEFGFSDMPNTNWPFSDYDEFQQVTEDWCRQSCIGDCFCAAVVYSSSNVCWKKKFPLSYGVVDPSVGGKTLVKVRINDKSGNPHGGNAGKSNRSSLVIIGSILFGSSVFLNLLLLFSVLLVIRFNRKRPKVQAHTALPGVNLRSFKFSELQEATNEFKEELGRGACSTVYKGILKDENGKVVAVKKLDKIPEQAEQEFKTEVSSISKTNHRNLVQLLGYCDEGEHKLLVYEFMNNGPLSKFLFENLSRPNWFRRVQIAFAITRGLCYLHEECNTQIIHCDIKPQNVLLDESYAAKISDFGLAKLLRPDQTKTTTGIRGTRGYVAPEWFRNMPITVKVDVYSFGILLLELICCRRTLVVDVDDENEMILADWAYDCYKQGTLRLLVANDEEALSNAKQFERFVMIALWCIQEDPSLRPHMKRVLHMLEGSAEVPAPPDPTSFIN